MKASSRKKSIGTVKAGTPTGVTDKVTYRAMRIKSIDHLVITTQSLGACLRKLSGGMST